MPGGVNSAARAFGAVGGDPIVMARGEGAYLFDIDGNRYIDYIGSWGPLILGHQYPSVKTAIQAAAENGTTFGTPTLAENELAELVIAAVPSMEMVRLVSSGTEATMSAIRVARGYTGRDLVVKFNGNYHGHVDSLLVAAGSSATTLGAPNSPGVTLGTTRDTIVLEYNNPRQVEELFQRTGDKIAGVILEPICGNMGCIVADSQFLAVLRSQTLRHGAVLIFDEVMTGFRVGIGGAQSLLAVQPDMTTLGKIVGGGLPLAVFGGKREIMQHVLPSGKVFQAGTLSGNPLATAAGIATLKELLENPPYEKLEALGERLEKGLAAACDHARIESCINRVGSMLTLFFGSGPVTDWQTTSRCNTELFARFFWGLIERGSYLPCSQFEAMFISAAHTTDDIDNTITAAEQALLQTGLEI